jgi:hypothetical protein
VVKRAVRSGYDQNICMKCHSATHFLQLICTNIENEDYFPMLNLQIKTVYAERTNLKTTIRSLHRKEY